MDNQSFKSLHSLLKEGLLAFLHDDLDPTPGLLSALYLVEIMLCLILPRNVVALHCSQFYLHLNTFEVVCNFA